MQISNDHRAIVPAPFAFKNSTRKATTNEKKRVKCHRRSSIGRAGSRIFFNSFRFGLYENVRALQHNTSPGILKAYGGYNRG